MMTEEELAKYLEERTAAQRRKIELSAARKAGHPPSQSTRDKALMSPDYRPEKGFDPRKDW